MNKKHIIMILLGLVASLAFAQNYRTRIMDFENPGSRRIRKTEEASHWYYRSLPEKSMTLKTEDVKRIQLRSFGIEKLRKPSIIIVINKVETPYNLTLKEFKNGYYLYEDLEFDVPAGTKSLEVLCFQRSIYMRAFEMYKPKPKPKTLRKPSRQITAHAGMIDLTHNGSSSEYYSFNQAQPFKFTLNNSRDCVVYLRARLTDRSLPSFSLYHNGEKVESYEFSLARTTKFNAQGVRHLTISKKIELPENANSSNYEFRADTDHMFMARPVFIKK
ncbi:MAG: hypothetical protein RBQ66_08295 [Candidatus Cloacimonadaceae bacterium]|jgi:hypothetical protein|nr:hypothetical protein [Candidatus Cloacimonadaceae bacterium]